MRVDLYTKMLLTLIVILLGMIAGKSVLQPNGVSAAGADFTVLCSSCYFSGLPQQSHLILIDRANGDIWAYSGAAMSGAEKPVRFGRLILGQPVARN